MKLFLMRHGEAEVQSISDETRRLTVQGEDKVRDTLASLPGEFWPEIICASPYVRAQQTARLAAEMRDNARVDTWNELVPEGEIEFVSERLLDVAHSVVLLVTHQPLITRLVRYITAEDVAMYPGSIIAIDVEQRHGSLMQNLRRSGLIRWIKHTN